MKLIEALDILKRPASNDARPTKVSLATGFTPLHLQTFLAAHLRKRSPQQRFEVQTGLFGNLAENIDRISNGKVDLLAIAIEWQDLDPRLGIRTLGGWRTTDLSDILQSATQMAGRLKQAVRNIPAAIPTCVSLPTLPLPPLFITRNEQAGDHELQLRQIAASLAASLSTETRTRFLSETSLDGISPANDRIDVQSEITAGFPYKLSHASAVAELFALLLVPPSPKRGLITDLDDTLWAGLLGEVGVNGISWHLEQHTQIHGLYQQFLESLASSGVLISVASKNDRTLVEEAFKREDLVIRKDSLYPLEVHWRRKLESVRRILRTWNIGPETVLFIDDNPMEVAEVNAAFPEMECILFPKDSPQAVWNLLRSLRDCFGKPSVSEEDAIRMKSIRNSSELQESLDNRDISLDELLKNANALIHFDFEQRHADTRAFELVNKTNQFNLNGRRLSESRWAEHFSDATAFLMTVSYRDKYGPLGKVAALLGRVKERSAKIDFWVMSCRAFSRRIEHRSLQQLFDTFDIDDIWFDFQATDRNGPLREFFTGLIDTSSASNLRITRSEFREKCPTLFHEVEENIHG